MRLQLSIILLILGSWSGAFAQDEALLYGKVTTYSGQEYIGNLRWGGEEAIWTDMFNASKLDNRVFGQIISAQRENENDSWLGIDWSFSSIWEDYSSGSVREFSCMFGNIQRIEYRDEKKLALTLRDGSEILVGGSNYNDVKASVRIMDDELGEITVKGSSIDQVEFLQTPTRLANKFGDPLYGVVATYEGDSVMGYIQWDHDERLSTDILDGKTSAETLKVPMGKISRITPMRGRARVVMNSGRQVVLSGTNDVNEGNSGIIVAVDGLGRVDINYSDIDYVNFKAPKKAQTSFERFRDPKVIRGTVLSITGEEYTGVFAYDRDEVWDFEILNGDWNNMEVEIPFSDIKTIVPKNAKYSLVVLRNGKKMLVGGSNDVTASNSGVLIFENREKEPISIRWSQIDEIRFD